MDQKELNDNLFNASELGVLEDVKDLLKQGAEIEYRDRHDYTSLMIASFKGHFKVVKYLVECGANIEAKEKKEDENALLLACNDGNLKIVRYLILKGANINVENKWGHDPLKEAFHSDNLNIVKFIKNEIEIKNILGSKYDYIKPRKLQLINAIKINPSIYDNLVKEDINLIKNSSELHHIIKSDEYGLFENTKNELIFKAAERASEVGNLKKIKELVKLNININQDKDILFRLACKNGHLDIIKWLLNHVVDINVNNGEALYNGININNIEMIKLLLDHNININSTKANRGMELICRNGKYDLFELLINAGYNISGSNGEYLLYNAAKEIHENNSTYNNKGSYNDYFNIIKYLVKNKVDSSDALEVASRKNKIDIVKYLVKSGGDWNKIAENHLEMKEYKENRAQFDNLVGFFNKINDKTKEKIINVIKKYPKLISSLTEEEKNKLPELEYLYKSDEYGLFESEEYVETVYKDFSDMLFQINKNKPYIFLTDNNNYYRQKVVFITLKEPLIEKYSGYILKFIERYYELKLNVEISNTKSIYCDGVISKTFEKIDEDSDIYWKSIPIMIRLGIIFGKEKVDISKLNFSVNISDFIIQLVKLKPDIISKINFEKNDQFDIDIDEIQHLLKSDEYGLFERKIMKFNKWKINLLCESKEIEKSNIEIYEGFAEYLIHINNYEPFICIKQSENRGGMMAIIKLKKELKIHSYIIIFLDYYYDNKFKGGVSREYSFYYEGKNWNGDLKYYDIHETDRQTPSSQRNYKVVELFKVLGKNFSENNVNIDNLDFSLNLEDFINEILKLYPKCIDIIKDYLDDLKEQMDINTINHLLKSDEYGLFEKRKFK